MTDSSGEKRPEARDEPRYDQRLVRDGFAVVARHASLGFTPVTNPCLARGFRFDEVWIFGEAQTLNDKELWRAVEPIIATMPSETIHRIPNVEDTREAGQTQSTYENQ